MNLKISARWFCLVFSLLLGVLPTAKTLAQSSTNITLLSANVNDDEFSKAVKKGGLIVFSSNTVVQLSDTLTITNDVIIDGRITNVVSVTNITVTNIISSVTNPVVTTNGLTNILVTNEITNFEVVGGITNPVVTNEVTNITITNFVTNFVTMSVTNTVTNPPVITFETNVPTLGNMAGVVGSGDFVLFRIAPNISAIFDHIQFSNGVSAYGGAISNGGNLVCSNSYFANNRAIGRNGRPGSSTSIHGVNGLGGAIFNAATSTLYQCYFVQNSALGGEGARGPNGESGSMFGKPGGPGGNGGFGIGGAIYNDSFGKLTVLQTAFNDNLASGGDGNSGGAGGSATFPGAAGDAGFGGAGYGGAIFNRGTNIISQSLFVDNFATGGNSPDQLNTKSGRVGGAALGGALCNNRLLFMDNSTVVSNTCVGGKGGGAQAGVLIYGGRGGGAAGGGIYNAGAVKGTPYMLALTNCTLAGGSVTNGAGGISATGDPKRNGPPGVARGGNLCVTTGSVLLQNTIMAYGFPTNSYGVLRNSSHNIVSDRSAGFARSALTVKNLLNTDPKLLPLADNGGVTFTMALGSGSPATTNGVDTEFPTDQRGTNRLSPFDVGAFEAVGPFTISGRLTFGTNSAITNGFVEVKGKTDPTFSLIQTNDATGSFSFVVPRGGYTFTPHLVDTNLMLTFKPGVVTNDDVTGDINNLNFVADSLTVKGTLKNKGGTNLPPGIQLIASNSYFGQGFSTTNNSKGYVLSGIPNVGTTVLMPKVTNAIVIAQPSAFVSSTNTNINFVIIPTYTISGTLTPKTGSGLTGDDLGQISVLLNTNTSVHVTNTLSVRGGKFGFSNVVSGTYYLTTDSSNFVFSPEVTKISVISNFTKLKVLVTKRP